MNTLKSTLLWSVIIFFFSFPSFGFETLFEDQFIDDCSPIRKEIARLPEAGGDVVIPSGDYTCRSPIVINRNSTRLIGIGDVIIRLAKNANSPVIIMGEALTPPQPLHDIQVLNLKIDGNRWYQKFECWGGPCDTGSTTFIRNNGITVRGVTDGLIQNVFITSARSGGVVTERGCFDLEVDHLTSMDNEFDGFAGYETFGARLTHLNLSNNKAAGISLDIRFNGNLFRDVKIENNGDVGVFMRDSSFNIFEEVTIENGGNHGVFLARAEDFSTCSINNDFQNLTVTRARGHGFRLNDFCEGNRLNGTTKLIQNRDGCIAEPVSGQLEIMGEVVCLE